MNSKTKYSDRVELLTTKIDNCSFDDALHKIETLIHQNNNAYIVTPNVDHLVKLQKDNEFKEIYDNANLILADGMPLIWASRFLNTPIQERVTGSDLFPAVCNIAAKKNYKVFLLGGRQGAALKAKKVLEDKFPGLQIVGTCCPPFGFEHDEQESELIIAALKKTKPDILFVGLGAPKQEKWIFKYRNRYRVTVSIGVGVSIEFMAGMVKRAPVWMQKTGLEWLWRLVNEPKKLWKRYLIDDLQFFKLILRQKIRNSRS